jgi:hypothetical protein
MGSDNRIRIVTAWCIESENYLYVAEAYNETVLRRAGKQGKKRKIERTLPADVIARTEWGIRLEEKAIENVIKEESLLLVKNGAKFHEFINSRYVRIANDPHEGA